MQGASPASYLRSVELVLSFWHRLWLGCWLKFWFRRWNRLLNNNLNLARLYIHFNSVHDFYSYKMLIVPASKVSVLEDVIRTAVNRAASAIDPPPLNILDDTVDP